MVTVECTINRIVSNIDYTLYVDLVGTNQVTCSNTMYCLDLEGWNFKVYDELNNYYTISNLVVNKSFTLVPDIPNTEFVGTKLFFDKRPFYIMGKPMAVNEEYKNQANISSDKLPLIWLLTSFTEDLRDEDSSMFNGSDIRLYFLTEAYSTEWTTAEHYSLSITAVRNMIERFVESLDKDLHTIRNSVKVRPWERFGRQTISGDNKLIIDDYLSGCEVVLDLDISNGCDC